MRNTTMVWKAKRIVRTFGKDILLGVFLGWFAMLVVAPAIANADADVSLKLPDPKTVEMMVSAMQNETQAFGDLPRAENAAARRTMTVSMTAYTSEVWQTDSTPFITASNTHVRDGIVAANFLPFGTKVRIPDLYGDKVFVVEDRMNKRYRHKVDIWMDDLQEARNFGIKQATIEIY